MRLWLHTLHMDSFTKLRTSVTVLTTITFLGLLGIVVLMWKICTDVVGLSNDQTQAIAGLTGVIAALFFANNLSKVALDPLRAVWQAVIRLSPEHRDAPVPRYDELLVGKNLAKTISTQIYRYTSPQADDGTGDRRSTNSVAAAVLEHLPLPIFICDKHLRILNANDAGIEYCQAGAGPVVGQQLFDSLLLEFATDSTLERWIAECRKNKVTSANNWERVRVNAHEGTDFRQCDLSAFYNRDDPTGIEYIIALHDRSATYKQDDDSLSFVSLAVHELRTPLTMMRGYVEALQEDLGENLDPELRGYLNKMEVSSAQLTSFVRNIMNVTKIENNQLQLNLTEESWDTVLAETVNDLQLRAQVNGKVIECTVAPNLPTLAIDRVSIYEVMANLVDNAIKYSTDTKATRIVIAATQNKNGLVETTVQDFGVGIPANVMLNLFSRFYRNHRTKTAVSGTGLGLYLCKALIGAHGGEIWAKSKEGQGTTIGFTLVPYAQLAADRKGKGEPGIVRQANGWIKNHSFYRPE